MMWWIALAVLGLFLFWYLSEKRQRRQYHVKPGLNEDITLPHEERFELYSNSLSLCSRKARICMAELGIAYKSHHVDLIETGSYENISKHYLKINPEGLVPALVFEGHPVYNSDDIIRFAADHAPAEAPSLVPEDKASREVMDHWVHMSSIFGDDPMEHMEETAGSCIPPLTMFVFTTAVKYIPVSRILEGLLFHRLKVRPVGFLLMKLQGINKIYKTPLRKMVTKGRDLMMGHLEELEAQLKTSGGPWITGEQFTLADVAFMSHFERMEESCWLEEYFRDGRLPETQSYWHRLKSRPSYQSAIVDHAHPIIEQAKMDLRRAKDNDADLQKIYRV